jgi:hypothetical protein
MSLTTQPSRPSVDPTDHPPSASTRPAHLFGEKPYTKDEWREVLEAWDATDD